MNSVCFVMRIASSFFASSSIRAGFGFGFGGLQGDEAAVRHSPAGEIGTRVSRNRPQAVPSIGPSLTGSWRSGRGRSAQPIVRP